MVDVSQIAIKNQCMFHPWAPIVRVTDGVWTLVNRGKKVLDTHVYDMLYMSCSSGVPMKGNQPDVLTKHSFEFVLSNKKVSFIRYSITLDYPTWVFSLPNETEDVEALLKSVVPIDSLCRITTIETK